jgi:hypothetical protein
MPDELLVDLQQHGDAIRTALLTLPIATIIGAALAFRPRRKGTPPRSSAVIQTQIVLAVVGALVMLVVGTCVARAFGIVGASNVIRYRAKIDDPKDAVVMLSTLSLGLACGVGLYGLASFAALFLLVLLWGIESFEPERRKAFELKVAMPDPDALRGSVESVLRRFDVTYELRTAGAKELVYEAQLPWASRTDRISNAILQLVPDGEKEVVWEEKKKK